MAKFSVAIQAGGASSRMGQDKGLLPFGPNTLVESIIEQVKPLGFEIYIVSNSPEDYRSLGLPVYCDIHPGIGALAGIHTILAYANTDYVLALACDMPFVELALIQYLLDQTPGYDVVIPALGEQQFLEPFRAVYSRSCLVSVERAIQEGERRVISFFDDHTVLRILPAKIHQFDPGERSFININTPEDYERLIADPGDQTGG